MADCDPSEVTIAPPMGDPSIDIRKDSGQITDPADVREDDPLPFGTFDPFGGLPVFFTILVINDGDVDLVDVAVTDMEFPACDLVIGFLAQGDSYLYQCSDDPPVDGFTNEACVEGMGAGAMVGDCDPATIEPLR